MQFNTHCIECRPYKNNKVKEHQQVLEDVENALHFECPLGLDKWYNYQTGLVPPVSSLTDFVT